MSTPAAVDEHRWGSAPEFYGPRHAYRESLMLRRLLPALPGPRVANVGCGAGSLTLAMLARGLSVVSLDASPEFVGRLAAQIAQRHPGADAPVLVADAHDLPLEDASVDGVTCGEVLEHLDDDLRAAREIARILRPGGVFVATVPCGPDRFDWVDAWAGHRRRYDRHGFARLLRDAGLVDVEVRRWGFPVTALYERLVYAPMLRRRVAAGGDGDDGAAAEGLGAPTGLAARLAPALRAALEVDTLFGDRGVRHPGLIAWGRAAPR
ncbi:MAG: class I SAM-dependent methyltransferase [Actinomycetota bacterium]